MEAGASTSDTPGRREESRALNPDSSGRATGRETKERTIGMHATLKSVTRHALLLAAMFVVASGSSTRAGDVFHACSNNRTHKLRGSTLWANASPICSGTTETMRTWNQGFDSCRPERFDGIDVPPHAYGLLNATCCPTEDFATGAGALWTTPFERADNGPLYSYPLSGNTWTIRPYNNTASTQGYALVLQCCGRQAVCGDGIKECGEACDPPMANSPLCGGLVCEPDCTCQIP